MRILFFFILALGFSACQNLDEYKPSIEQLQNDWTAQTAMVDSLQREIEKQKTDFLNEQKAFKFDVNVVGSMVPEKSIRFKEAEKACHYAINGYATITAEMATYLTEWQKQTQEMDALSSGLKKGKIDGDIPSRIADLRAKIEESQQKMTTWKSNANAVSAACRASFDNFKVILEEYFPGQNS